MSTQERSENQSSPWSRWVETQLTLAGATTTELVNGAGINHTRLSRWRQGVGVSAETVRVVCKFFDRPVLEGMVAAGIVKPEEAWPDETQSPRVEVHRVVDAAQLTTDELVAEIARRLGATPPVGQ